MKKLIYIIIATVFVFSGCEKEFLEKESLSAISDATFWKDIKDAELALMGCYDALQDLSLYKGNGYVSGAGIAQLDAISDDAYCKSTWMRLVPLSTGKYDPTSWGNDQIWKACYILIARANKVIKFVPDITNLDEIDSRRIVAEAKVLRATIYNLLTMTYADVPLITEPQELENASVPKDDKSTTLQFIIDDLEVCYEDLPVDVEGWGRITQGAALGMLARIYLYNGDWSDAASTAQKVMDLEVYSLYPDYSSLFKPENEMNDEVIFPVTFEYGVGGEGSAWNSYYSSRGYTHYRVALPNLVDEYYCTDGLPTTESLLYDTADVTANRDPRLLGTITSNGWPGWPGKETHDPGAYFPQKYVIENRDQRNDSPQDYYLIRYAHVLLIKAEALAQQGPDPEIYNLINQIRDRVGMPHIEEVEGAGLSQLELLDLVKHERRIETAFEFLRYFDLKRWGEIQEKYDYYNAHEYDNFMGVPGESYYKGMVERVWDTKYEKWPIPQAEMDANKELVQHPGY